MFEAFWDFWDLVTTGGSFCGPFSFSTRWSSSSSSSSDSEDGLCTAIGTTSCVQDVWRVALQTGQLKLQKCSVDSFTVDFLLEETNKLQASSNSEQRTLLMSEILLFWCSFHLTDGTCEGMLELIEAHGCTLTAIRFWKTRDEDTIPNELVWHLFTSSIPQKKLPNLKSLELSYFDFRQRNLSHALASALSYSRCCLSSLDISYCKTNQDFFTRLFEALKSYRQLQTLCLSGTGIDDATLKIICHGISETSSSLRQLHLSRNFLTSSSLPLVALLLKKSSSSQLEALHLQRNEALFSPASSSAAAAVQLAHNIQLLATALPEATVLQTLNLAGCGLSNHAATILFTSGLKSMPALNQLDLSHNDKLQSDLKWLLPLCRHCKTLHHLTLPLQLRTDSRQWDILSKVLQQYNTSLLQLFFDDDDKAANASSIITANTTTRTTLSKPMEDLLRRNQLLYLARTFAPQLSVCLWPRVVVRLGDNKAPGSSTSVYGFLQKCLIG